MWVQKTGGRAGVSKVELRGNSGMWQSMNNVWGASWETPQAPPPPLDIRITDDQGNTVIHLLYCKITVQCDFLKIDEYEH